MIQPRRIGQRPGRTARLSLPDDPCEADGARPGREIDGVGGGRIGAERHGAVHGLELDVHVAAAADCIGRAGVGDAAGTAGERGAGRLRRRRERIDCLARRPLEIAGRDDDRGDVLAGSERVSGDGHLLDEVRARRRDGELVFPIGAGGGCADEGVVAAAVVEDAVAAVFPQLDGGRRISVADVGVGIVPAIVAGRVTDKRLRVSSGSRRSMRRRGRARDASFPRSVEKSPVIESSQENGERGDRLRDIIILLRPWARGAKNRFAGGGRKVHVRLPIFPVGHRAHNRRLVYFRPGRPQGFTAIPVTRNS